MEQERKDEILGKIKKLMDHVPAGAAGLPIKAEVFLVQRKKS